MFLNYKIKHNNKNGDINAIENNGTKLLEVDFKSKSIDGIHVQTHTHTNTLGSRK